MKVLLDKSLPRKLRNDFSEEHEVLSVRDMGWLTKEHEIPNDRNRAIVACKTTTLRQTSYNEEKAVICKLNQRGMNNTFIAFEELKKMYPDEWILLGNPIIKDTSVLGGAVLFHSKDKKEVCYIGRDKTADYTSVTIAYAGDLKQRRRIGILRKL